jgi:hypothetical protein
VVVASGKWQEDIGNLCDGNFSHALTNPLENFA